MGHLCWYQKPSCLLKNVMCLMFHDTYAMTLYQSGLSANISFTVVCKSDGRGGGGGAPPPPATELGGGQTYHFAPFPRNLERAPRENCRKCKEQHYTSSVALGRFRRSLWSHFMRSEDPGSLMDTFGSAEGPVGNSEDPFSSFRGPFTRSEGPSRA